MKRLFYYLIPVCYLLSVVPAGCNQTQNPSSGTPTPMNAPPPSAMQPAPPPSPQPLTLYMVPSNQAEFSMETIQANKKRIEQEPNNVQALISLADANFMIQRFEAARGYYERALKVDRKLMNARLSLANCYIFMQKPDEAIMELDQILNFEKDYAEALFNKGLILLQSKRDVTGAKQAWTRLVRSHPEHPLARQVQKELGRL